MVWRCVAHAGPRSSPLTNYDGGHTEPFEDEIHPRLRFAHRGIVGMANNGAKNSNDSQFFITLGAFLVVPAAGFVKLIRGLYGLDRADELHGKHTLFGRCVGDTFYSTTAFHSRVWSLPRLLRHFILRLQTY